MSLGAGEFDADDHPLLGALTLKSAKWPSLSLSYAFAPQGEAFYGYFGASTVTNGWSPEQQRILRESFQEISSVTTLKFREISANSSEFVDVYLENVQEIGGGYAGFATTVQYSPGARIAKASIGARHISAGDKTILHELGHVLGLEHPFEGRTLPGVSGPYDAGAFGLNSSLYTIMTYRDFRSAERPELRIPAGNHLMPLDVAALQALYGANQSHNSGNNLYGLREGVATIWDAGGVDAIDFRRAKTDVVIDLRAATLELEAGGGGRLSFTTLGGQPNLVSGGYLIAYGVVVENGFGGSGADEIIGNDAANHLQGGAGDDRLYGGAGDDRLNGGLGADLLDGGEGRDRASYAEAASGVRADLQNSALNRGEAAGDRYLSIEDLEGSAFADHLSGDAGANRIWGGAGDDELYGRAGDDVLEGGLGADLLNGGAGYDAASYAGASAGVTADLSAPRQNRGEAAGDRYVSIENLIGSRFDDRLIGDARNNLLEGGAGDDLLEGRAGADRLYGGAGDDLLKGGAGNDRLYGGAGEDRLWGGAGDDVLEGGVGDDFLYGEAGHDQLRGGAGNDFLEGGAGNDLLYGEAGDDRLFGGAGNDQLRGGAGDDILEGGLGGDLLWGGAGRDVFVFRDFREVANDRILDFVSGVDKLDFSRMDADPARAGTQKFTGLIQGAFTAPGQLRFDAANSTLYGNLDGDSAPEFRLALEGLRSLTDDDFLF